MSIRKLAQLRRSLKKFHITQDEVAAAVLPRPVHRTQVNHVLHGRVVSRRVLEAAALLIAARQAAAAGTHPALDRRARASGAVHG